MQAKFNLFGNLFRQGGQAVEAGFGATIDTLIRFMWLSLFTLSLGFLSALLVWWLPVLIALLLIPITILVALSSKGLWTVAFLGGFDVVAKSVPQRIKELYPGIRLGEFRLLRRYVRGLLLILCYIGFVLLLASWLPISAHLPLALVLLVLALFFVLAVLTQSGIFKFVYGALMVVMVLYFTTLGGDAQLNRWIKAVQGQTEAWFGGDAFKKELDAKTRYGVVLADAKLLNAKGAYLTGDDVEVKAGTYIHFTSPRPVNSMDSPDAQVKVRLPDKVGFFSKDSRVGFLTGANVIDVRLEEYRNYLKSRGKPAQSTQGQATGRSIRREISVQPRAGVTQTILVVKNTKSEPLQLYWVDYSGQEIRRTTIAPGERWPETTYAGCDVFVARDPVGKMVTEMLYLSGGEVTI